MKLEEYISNITQSKTSFYGQWSPLYNKLVKYRSERDIKEIVALPKKKVYIIILHRYVIIVHEWFWNEIDFKKKKFKIKTLGRDSYSEQTLVMPRPPSYWGSRFSFVEITVLNHLHFVCLSNQS